MTTKKLGISYILLLNSYIVKTDEISNLMMRETHTSFESLQKTIYRLCKEFLLLSTSDTNCLKVHCKRVPIVPIAVRF